MKHKILFTLYSLSLIPIWGLSSLEPAVKGFYWLLAAMLFTGFSIHYLIKKSKNNTKLKTALPYAFIGPAIYLIVALVTSEPLFWILDPIIWFCFLMAVVVLLQRQGSNKTATASIIAVSLLYSVVIYPRTPFISRSTADKSAQISANAAKWRLGQFNFLTQHNQNLSISSSKAILLETWNEKCGPCMKSIKDLAAFIDSRADSVEHYLLYLPFGTDTIEDYELPFTHPAIKNPEKVIMDPSNRFEDAYGLSALPCFMVFRPDGGLSDLFIGYTPNNKTATEARLDAMFRKALE